MEWQAFLGIIAIIGNKITYLWIPIPLAITNINTIIHDIKKFISALVATDIGNISLGKNTFLIIFSFPKIVVVPCCTTVVKKFHGITPTIKNIK